MAGAGVSRSSGIRLKSSAGSGTARPWAVRESSYGDHRLGMMDAVAALRSQVPLSLDNEGALIGGHPMAGSHKSGVWAGRSGLFENACYFQIPLNDLAQKRLSKLHDLLRATKVKWLEITAPEHDKAVAQISHLPHIIAAGLVNQTEETFKGASVGIRLAAGGFKAITRIASSDPTMWNQILLTNSADIFQQLAKYQQVLDQLAQKIKDRDEAALYQYFAVAKSSRDQLGPERSWPAIFRKLGKTNR